MPITDEHIIRWSDADAAPSSNIRTVIFEDDDEDDDGDKDDVVDQYGDDERDNEDENSFFPYQSHEATCDSLFVNDFSFSTQSYFDKTQPPKSHW